MANGFVSGGASGETCLNPRCLYLNSDKASPSWGWCMHPANREPDSEAHPLGFSPSVCAISARCDLHSERIFKGAADGR